MLTVAFEYVSRNYKVNQYKCGNVRNSSSRYKDLNFKLIELIKVETELKF